MFSRCKKKRWDHKRITPARTLSILQQEVCLGSWVWQHSAFKEEDHARLDITHHPH